MGNALGDRVVGLEDADRLGLPSAGRRGSRSRGRCTSRPTFRRGTCGLARRGSPGVSYFGRVCFAGADGADLDLGARVGLRDDGQRVRSFMASIKGVDQCAEWSAIEGSSPARIRATIFLPVSGVTSAWRTCPHQIRTRRRSGVSSESPWSGSSSATDLTENPGWGRQVVGDLVAEEVRRRPASGRLPLVPDDDADGACGVVGSCGGTEERGGREEAGGGRGPEEAPTVRVRGHAEILRRVVVSSPGFPRPGQAGGMAMPPLYRGRGAEATVSSRTTATCHPCGIRVRNPRFEGDS